MRLRLPLHGRSHRAIGADPIWPGDPILFNYDNQGGWLWVVTNDSTDIDYGELGLALVDRSEFGIYLRSEGGGGQFGYILLEYGALTLDAGSGHPLVLRGDQVQITDIAGAGASIQTDGPIDIQSFTNSTSVTLAAGQKLVVNDSSSNPIFEVREDGTIHILTGGTIVADL